MEKSAKNKLQRILEGWKNLIKTNPEVEKIANSRAIKCASCEHLNNLLFCKKCGCFVPAKIRSTQEKCKERKW